MTDVLSKSQIKIFLSTFSRYRIAKDTGIKETTLSNYANGTTGIGKMSFDNALKITSYLKSLKGDVNTRAKEILIQIKSNDIQYFIQEDSGKVYANKDTNKIMDIYGLNENSNHYYGVYSDIDDNNVDSRQNTDDEILNVIENMLVFGKPINRALLPKDADLKLKHFIM